MRNKASRPVRDGTRPRFPHVFKAGAVRLALDESRTVESVTRGLDLTPQGCPVGSARGGTAEQAIPALPWR